MRILKTPWLRVLLLLVALGVAGWRFAQSGDVGSDIPAVEVVRGQLRMTLEESGELRAKRSATITAPNDKLITYLAPEGSWVQEGDLLVQLESAKYEIAVQESQSSLQVALAQLEKAKSDLQAQKYKEEAAAKQFASLQELQRKGFAMESEVEEARLNHLELQSKTGSFEAAVEQEKSEVERARNALDQVRHRLASNAVFAPIAGLVVYSSVGSPEDGKKVELGLTPYEGQPLMELPDVTSMQVLTEVNEMDVEKVRVGQEVEVRLDAVPDAVFRGRVATLGTLARHKVSRASGKRTGVKVFSVEIDIADADERLRPGLSATVAIHVDTFDDVTYAPVEAIFREEGRAVAYVRRGRDVYAVDVDCGASNDTHVIIRAGLEPGDRVLLARPDRTS